MRITVRVDSAGRPSMETLNVTGPGATDNRDAVEEWIRSSRFQPAQRAGHAVEGVYQTRIQSRTEVRRFGARNVDGVPMHALAAFNVVRASFAHVVCATAGRADDSQPLTHSRWRGRVLELPSVLTRSSRHAYVA